MSREVELPRVTCAQTDGQDDAQVWGRGAHQAEGELNVRMVSGQVSQVFPGSAATHSAHSSTLEEHRTFDPLAGFLDHLRRCSSRKSSRRLCSSESFVGLTLMSLRQKGTQSAANIIGDHSLKETRCLGRRLAETINTGIATILAKPLPCQAH